MIDWQKKTVLRHLAYWSVIPGDDFDKAWAKWLLGSDHRWDTWSRFVAYPMGKLHCLFYDHIFTYQLCDLCGKRESGYGT